MLCNKHLFCSAGFGEREIRLSARTGEFTRVSGACNGEFGGAAVSRNQVMIVRENLSAEATKNPTETSGFFGGEREIRTLEPRLTVTRFPIVRPRPARRHLLDFQPLNSIYQNGKFCNLFISVFLKKRRNFLYITAMKCYNSKKPIIIAHFRAGKGG